MSFTPIETQEQLDALIGERVTRAKESVRKEYADYEELKKNASEGTAKIAELTKSLEEANEKIASHASVLAEKDDQIKKYESDSVKTRIAHEVGLGYEAVSLLQGEDEESIRASAEKLKKYSEGRHYEPDFSRVRVSSGDDNAKLNDAYKNLINNF